MKTLPDIKYKNGFRYTQLLHEGRKYLYEQRVDKNNKHYEVFIARIKPEQSFDGRIYPERHVFPSNEDFGYTAWSYSKYKQAMEKFDTL